ncbi:hypothetical protein TNCV_2345831 [Trichonephila clavipes]|nr:hypothetical protein TNCV_2345831 [Trichonephila clavipes]
MNSTESAKDHLWMELGKPRGYSSRVGVCAVIGDKTGKGYVIDAEVMSSFCKGCDSWKRRKVSPTYKVENSSR